MAELEGTKTYENLKAAFAEEAQNNRRFLFYAKQADLAGDVETAALFAQIAESRSNHAQGHFQHTESIEGVQASLKSASDQETEICKTLYPNFVKIARDEGLDDIAEWFERVVDVKKKQAAEFKKVLDSLNQSN